MKRAILAVFFAVFLWHVYRASTEAVTFQEAVTYNEYASKPVLRILTGPYSPANQIFHSLLCSLVLRVFRVTEFSFRIASLLGFAFYLWAARRLVAPSTWGGFVTLALFAVNPFTIGWMPESTGIWMASGFFLVALRKFLDFDGEPRQLSTAGLQVGLACSFHIGLLLPSIALFFVFLHFQFWGPRRVSAMMALNRLFLPLGLLLFAVWVIPLLNAPPGTLLWLRLLEMDWIVLLPGLAAVGIKTRSKACLGVLGVLLLALAALPQLNLGWVPDRFHAGPESALPAVARALRDVLRRNPPRATRVTANADLVQPMEFYRRRYSLGSVQKIGIVGRFDKADYAVILDADPANRPLFSRGRISLIRKDAP